MFLSHCVHKVFSAATVVSVVNALSILWWTVRIFPGLITINTGTLRLNWKLLIKGVRRGSHVDVHWFMSFLINVFVTTTLLMFTGIAFSQQEQLVENKGDARSRKTGRI